MTANRPLSPHLTIYKPQITSVLSIIHRITGIILSSSVLGIIVWLMALQQGRQTYYSHQQFYHHFFGKTIMLIWLGCFYYHLANGIRHLFWDMGYGFDLKTVYKSGFFVLGWTSILSIMTIFCLFGNR